jgi:hypothetical protein
MAMRTNNLKTSIGINNERVFEFVNSVFGQGMHLKRVESLANAALGLLHSEELLLHKIGEGLAFAKGLDKKHATKQVDRLLSNKKLDIWQESEAWVPFIVGARNEIMISMDWTDFDADNQSTIAVNLITEHGRATPLLWKSINKSSLKHNRARYEDQILSRLKEILPAHVDVTVLADRGFADQEFFKFITDVLDFSYIIRIRGTIYITGKDKVTQHAKDWLRPDGHIRTLEKAAVTRNQCPVEKFVCTKQKDMKDAWYLVSDRKDLSGSAIVKYYSKRWRIEPYFRDIKDQRFGMGLASTHISTPERRDRLFFISTIAIAILTLLGAAGESIGFDRKLKVNTVKTRTHSLLRQGIFYYKFLQKFTEDERTKILDAFNKLLEGQSYWKSLFLCL